MARQQQHQQSIATSEPVESAATDVAREAFVLPGEGIQRQAHQQHRRQQPQPGSLKAGWSGWASRNQKLSHTANGSNKASMPISSSRRALGGKRTARSATLVE